MIFDTELPEITTGLAQTHTRPGEIYNAAPEKSKRLIHIFCEVLDAPKGAPQMLETLTTVHAALEELGELLQHPTAEFTALRNQTRLAREAYEAQLVGEVSIASAASSLKGLRAKHPVWATLAKLSSERTNCLVLTMIGLELLVALKQSGFVLLIGEEHQSSEKKTKNFTSGFRGRSASNNRVRGDIRVDVNRLLDQQAPDRFELRRLLEGDFADGMIGTAWLVRLRRNWMRVVETYGDGRKITLSYEETVHGEINSSAMYSDATALAGAITHREMSQRQWQIAIAHLSRQIAADTWPGTLGLLTLRTSLSLNTIAALPIVPFEKAESPDGESVVPTPHRKSHMCVELGVVTVNAEAVFAAAADARSGMLDAQHIVRIRLPRNLHQHLVKRYLKYPAAKTLSALYPEAVLPNSDGVVADKNDGIEGTWARFRGSTAIHLRAQGYNSLHAALLCCNLRMTPVSKHYYAVVPSKEMHAIEDQLYRDLGFDDATDSPIWPTAYGARVVPQTNMLVGHDRALLAEVDRLRPGNHCKRHTLLEFHNAYTRLCGWRLSLLLALRATSAIDLAASIDEGVDLWIAIDDKITSSGLSAQPVPLGRFCAQTIGLYKAHCKAVGQRVSNLEQGPSAFSMRCAAVSRSENQHLLFLVDEEGSLRTPRSLDMLLDPQTHYDFLPKDVGRKVMENQLREYGLPSSHIDFFLRHFTEGQVRSHVFHCQALESFVRRVIPAQDAIAQKILGAPVSGLRATMREDKR